MTLGTVVIGGCAGAIRGNQNNGNPASGLPPALEKVPGLSNHPASTLEVVGRGGVLPRFGTPTLGNHQERAGEITPGNGETVLLVEDEPQILELARVMLEKIGYRVLAAGTPEQALEIAEKHALEIQLLLTDVLMPVMNGLDLAEQMQTLYPGMKVMFMSGYSGSAVFSEGVARHGAIFLAKPFTLRMLADKVGAAVRKTSVHALSRR